MRILINCSNLLHGGALQVANSLIRDLVNFPEHSYCVITTREVEEQLLGQTEFPGNFRFISYQWRHRWFHSFSLKEPFLNQCVKEFRADAVYSVFGPCGWRPRVPHVCGYAKPHYIYKESPFFWQLDPLARFKLRCKELVHMDWFRRSSDGLVTESEDVSQRLQPLLPQQKIFTVTNNYNQIFDEPLLQQEFLLPRFHGFSLLTITANYPHKNLSIYPRVIRYLRSAYPGFQFRFILTIPEELLASWNLQPSEREHVLCIGKVNVHQCPSLYRQSDFMFLPTLLECFSASYPEAMRMNVPILTSDLSFARGLCGEAACYFDPMSPSSIGDAIYLLANDHEAQKRLIRAGQIQLGRYDGFRDRTRKYLDIIIKLATKGYTDK